MMILPGVGGALLSGYQSGVNISAVWWGLRVWVPWDGRGACWVVVLVGVGIGVVIGSTPWIWGACVSLLPPPLLWYLPRLLPICGGPVGDRQCMAIFLFASRIASETKQIATLCCFGFRKIPNAQASQVLRCVSPVISPSVLCIVFQYGWRVGQLQNMW